MLSHRRGRSLSDALTLERSDEGGLVVSSINNSASSNQGLSEGDEILGATINFDQLSKDEVLRVLKLMEPFDDKIQVLTRKNLSKSMDNLDHCVKTPETMLKDSYNKLYNAKIKKFMRDDLPGAEENCVNREVTAKPTVPGSSKVNLKHDMGLPRLGVDFGLLKTKTLSKDVDAGELTYDSNLNLPPLALSGAQLPRLKVNASNPQLNTPDLHLSGTLPDGPNTTAGIQLPNNDSPSFDLSVPRPQIGRESYGNIRGPEVGIDLKGSDLSTPDMGINVNGGNITDPSFDTGVPKVDIEGTNKDFKLPKFKLPNLGLSGPECEVNPPDIGTPEVPSGKLSLKYSKKLKNPSLNVDSPSSYAESPKLKLSGRSPDTDLKMSVADISQLNPNGLDIDMPSGDVRVPSKIGLKSPDLDIDAPSGKFTLPKFGVSSKSDAYVKTPDLSLKTPKIKGGIHAPDLNLPKADLKGPNFAFDTPSAGIKGPSGKYKAPRFRMPKFDLPDIQVPSFNGDLVGPHMQLAAPDLKVKGPEYDLNTPDMDVSTPKFKGGINLPGANLKDPKLNLNTPDLDINLPSGKLGNDADAPSGKVKLPKFKLFGTLPKKKDVDINAGLKTPELSLKSPKLNGIDAPDMSLPNMDLKAPNLDLQSPDVNVGSPKGKFTMPKMKMPSFDLSGPKGANIDMDASLNRPDLPSGGLDVDLSKPEFDIDAPSLDLKGPRSKLKMPEADIGSPSGKMKMPSFTMPDFGLSGPKLKGLDGELKTPDFDLSAPKFKRALGSPDLKLPEMDLNKPKLDLSGPDVNLDMPSGKLKMPELHAPDWDVNAPSGKMKMPKFNLSGTLPKGPNMDLNADLKSPDLSLKAPKIKGGIDAPDLDLPNMDLKAPKLDVNAPDLNIGSPKAKFKMPKMKMPKFGLPSLKGPEIDGPDVDINAPNVNLKGPKADLDVDIAGPSGKFKKPNFNLPDFGLSGPKLDGPNWDLKSHDLDISGPNLGGGLNAPDINMPKVDLKSPKLDLNSPKLNLDMPSGKLKMPELHAPDWDVNAPSGKLKMPNFNLSGTLPKGPNMDINADMNSPDLSLKAPKMKGGIDAPDLHLPNMDLKAPKLDMNTPDVNFGSPKAKLKKPKLKMPKVSLPHLKRPEIDGNYDVPDIDINAPNFNLKGSKPGFGMPDVDFGSPSGKIKTPHLKMPDVGFTSPKLDGPNFDFKSPDLNAKLPKGPNLNINSDLKTPDFNLKTPKMKGGIDAPKFGLSNVDLKAPNLDMNTPDVNIGLPDAKFKKPKMPKGPNVDINGDLHGPDLNIPNVDVNGPKGRFNMPSLNAPDLSLSGGMRGPDVDMNVPSGNIQGPQNDFDLADRKFKLPSFKLPQFGGPDLTATGSDIDFGASLRPTNLDITPPKLNMKPPQLKGNTTDPNVSAPNMNLSMQNAAMRNPQLHLKHPDLNIDNASLNFNGPSFKNRRSDITGLNMKMPVLDVDRDVRLHHTDRSPRTQVRSSYPLPDANLGHNIDFNHSDLNIDDFTGRDHVPRARGSKMDLQASYNYRQRASPSGVNIDMRDPRHTRQVPSGDIYVNPPRTMQQLPNARLPQDPRIRVPDSTDGYFVTVFPNEAQNQRMPNRKYNTLGGPNFYPRNIDLEVPGEDDVKGSTFFFSNLM